LSGEEFSRTQGRLTMHKHKLCGFWVNSDRNQRQVMSTIDREPLRSCMYAMDQAAENVVSMTECHLGRLKPLLILWRYGAARSRALSKPGSGPSFPAACWRKKELTAFINRDHQGSVLRPSKALFSSSGKEGSWGRKNSFRSREVIFLPKIFLKRLRIS
jgi:hypothetical protein